MVSSQEVARYVARSSAQRLRRIVNQLRERYKDVPRAPTFRDFKEFPKVSQHPAVELAKFRGNVSQLIDAIQDEDRERLLEPQGPKVLRGHKPRARPKTAIIARAAQAALERRLERERIEAAHQALASQRRA